MASIHVGAGRAYAKLSAAVQAARSGDTIYVEAGTYENDFVTITKDLTIVGVGGLAHLKGSQDIPNLKAIMLIGGDADVVVENLEFSGARVRDDNGAGIKLESGNLTVRDSYFHDNQNGILTSADSDAAVIVDGSRFVGNGNNDGYTHGIYAGRIDRLTVTDSTFEATREGSHVKSRAGFTEVRDSQLIDGNGKSNYGIDLSNANTALIDGNLLVQAADTSNRTMINYGSEAKNPGTLTVTNNTLINYRSLATGVYNRTTNDAVVQDNVFVNVSSWIVGSASGDNIRGFLGDAGNDTLTGGAGIDRADYRFAPAGVTADLATGTAADGFGGTDRLSGIEQLTGSQHADRLTGNAQANRLEALAGNDTLSGGDGNDSLSGGGHSDRLYGGAGADRLNGGAGTDSLYGGTGSDTLSGGPGNDHLHGGSGGDMFRFTIGEGRDVVADFQGDRDTLAIRGVTTLKALDIVKSGANVVITFDDDPGSRITLTAPVDFGSDDILIG